MVIHPFVMYICCFKHPLIRRCTYCRLTGQKEAMNLMFLVTLETAEELDNRSFIKSQPSYLLLLHLSSFLLLQRIYALYNDSGGRLLTHKCGYKISGQKQHLISSWHLPILLTTRLPEKMLALYVSAKHGYFRLQLCVIV